MLPGQTVLAVTQLDELAHAVPHRPVIVDHAGLHGFDQPTLDVARLGRLDGRINQTLTTAHSVEVELGGRQAGQIRVLDEATRLRTVVVLDEVRQSSLPEAERNTFTLDVLLADASDNLSTKLDSISKIKRRSC